MDTKGTDATLEQDVKKSGSTTTDVLDTNDLGYGTAGSTGSNEVSHDKDGDAELTKIAYSTPTYPPDPRDFDETDCHLVWDEELRDWIFHPSDPMEPTTSEYVRLLFSPDEWQNEYIRFYDGQW